METNKLTTTVLIVLAVVLLAVVLLAVGLGVGYILGKQSIRDGTHEVKLDLSPSIDAMSGRIDAAKWSEGKAMMGTIATAIRAYCAEVDEDVSDLAVLDFDSDLGFRPGDLLGTYFTQKNFSITEGSYDMINNQLTFTIKATKGDTINSPDWYTLDQDGTWLSDGS
jgi:hypothetical protein